MPPICFLPKDPTMRTYYIIQDNERRGPYSYEDLVKLSLDNDVLVWHEDSSDWIPYSLLQKKEAESANTTPPPMPTWMSKKRRKRKKIDKRSLFICACVLFGILTLLMIVFNPFKSDDEKALEASKNLKPTIQKVESYASASAVSKLRTYSAQLNGTVHRIDNTIKEIRFKYSDGTIVKYAPIQCNWHTGKVDCIIDCLLPNTPYAFCIETETDSKIYESPWLTFITLPKAQPITIVNSKKNKRTGSLLTAKNLPAKKKNLIECCDYQDSIVLDLAKSFIPSERKQFNLGHICDLFDFCYDNWTLTEAENPKLPYQKASDIIKNRFSGTSDDFAILVCSLFLAKGIDVRINTTLAEEGEHVYTEINLGYINLKEANEYLSRRYATNYSGMVNYRVDQYGHQWLNLDWRALHPGGDYYDGYEGTRIYILSNYCESF